MNQEPNNNQNNNQRPQAPNGFRKPNFFGIIVIAMIIIGIWVFSSGLFNSSGVDKLNANEFEQLFVENRVTEMVCSPISGNDGLFSITGTYTNEGKKQKYSVVLLETQVNSYAERINE